MLRKESEAVREGSVLVPQQEKFGSGGPTLADVYRMLKEQLDRSHRYWYSMRSQLDQQLKKMDQISDEMRVIDQRITRLEEDARQPRLAMEADGPANTKTRERTASARRAPPLQFKRCLRIAFLLAGLIPARRPTRPVSA